MESISSSQEKEFVRAWLHKLCLKGITSINLGHDPGLRGLMAVTRYLEEKTIGLLWNDGIKQIYMAFFQPSPIEGVYGRLEMFLVQSLNVVGQRFEFGKGTTFDFSVYKHGTLARCELQVLFDFAEELAEVFAEAYNGSLPGK